MVAYQWVEELDPLGTNNDAETSELILDSGRNVASLAVAPQSPSSRDAGLFIMKFFTELRDYSSGSINGRMV